MMNSNTHPRMKIQAYKYGNRLHYEWETRLLERTATEIFVLGERGRQLHHHTKQKIFTVSNWTIEYFSSQSWFTVSADVADGRIVHYYCNINEPAVITEDTVSFVDLDLDLLGAGGKWRVVDEEEFVHHSAVFQYPAALIERAKEELAALQTRAEQKQYPFDGTLERYIAAIPQ